MDLLIIVLALAALMTVAYRGYSVIIFAPIVALTAVLFFEPLDILPAYTNLFMLRTSEFVRNYFPLFVANHNMYWLLTRSSSCFDFI